MLHCSFEGCTSPISEPTARICPLKRCKEHCLVDASLIRCTCRVVAEGCTAPVYVVTRDCVPTRGIRDTHFARTATRAATRFTRAATRLDTPHTSHRTHNNPSYSGATHPHPQRIPWSNWSDPTQGRSRPCCCPRLPQRTAGPGLNRPN